MKTRVNFLTGIALITTLAACSTQEVRQDATTAHQAGTIAPREQPATTNEAEPMPAPNPPMTVMKAGKKLNLVRIMDGGICKNEFEGAKGTFLLYADPNDIERIKREKGTAVFSDFETKIEGISGDVLQEAIDKTNISEDPFALGDDEAQQKLAHSLAHNFHNAATKAIRKFQKETTLTIDIAAFPPSFIFYQKGCEVSTVEPPEPDSYS